MSHVGRNEGGLPSNLQAERMVLGSVLLDEQCFPEISGILSINDFSLEKHRVIFRRMGEINELGDHIDRVTLANELMRYGELESVDGMSYLISLDDGLPKILNIKSYASIVKEKSSLRQLIFAAQKIMNQAMLAEDSPATIAGSAVEKIHELGIDQGAASSYTAAQVLQKEPGIEALLAPKSGLSTGFPGLDRLTYGLLPGHIYVVGASTSTGKSAIVLNIAQHVAGAGTPVAYFSLEMSKESLLQRMLCGKAKVSLDSVNGHLANDTDRMYLRRAAAEIENYPIHIDASSSLSVQDFYRKTTQLIRKHGIGLAVVDYVQIMDWQSGKNGMPKFSKEYEAITYITRTFKEYSRLLGIPIIEVSQLSRSRTLRSAKDLRPKLGDLHGCVTADTLVMGPRAGVTKISEVKPGDRIFVIGPDQKVSMEAIKNAWPTGIKPVFRMTTQTGKTIEASGNHPFLTSAGYRPLSDIRPGDLVACPYSLPPEKQTDAESMGRCRLMGYLIGDGSYTKHRHVGFTNADRQTFSDCCTLVATLYPEVETRVKTLEHYREAEFVRVFDNGYGRPHGNPLREWLREVGVFGERDYQKQIPPFIFAAGEAGICQFLSAYLLTDGSLSGGKYVTARYCTSSLMLARQVQLLLLQISVASSITVTRDKKKTRQHHRSMYNVEIARNSDNMTRFLNCLDLVGKKKRLLDRARLKAKTVETGPGIFGLPHELSRQISALTVGRKWRQRWYFERKCLRRSTAKEWGEKLNSPEILAWANSDLLWEPVLTIEPIGEAETWDLEMPEHHNFVANGFAVHNSGSIEKDADVVILIYREELDHPAREELEGLAEVSVLKNRSGRQGTVNMRFYGDYCLFTEQPLAAAERSVA